jgi:hypothetical protein
MKHLDFIVIGAQKCATTTLFELLRQHPDISMPLEKELPFFTRESCGPQDWVAFADTYYPPADSRLWGKVTPQYMGDARVPARIAAEMPNTRLIAVLRDPIERCRSHFRMGQRRHTESRSFDEAMRDRLSEGALAGARQAAPPSHCHGYESESDFYLIWSEYGRILRDYREHFPQNQMLVIYTDELETQPAATLQRVLDFLGLARQFKPRGLGDVMHAGGGGNRVPHELRVWLRQRSVIAGLWALLPAQQQGRLRFLYERWNSRKRKDPLPLNTATEQQLRRHFARDAQLLETLGFASAPWAPAYALSTGNETPGESPALLANREIILRNLQGI